MAVTLTDFGKTLRKLRIDHDAEIAIMFARKVDNNTIDFDKLRKFLMEN